MRRVIPITEQYQHFVADLQGSFWGDCYGQARRFVNQAIERESIRLREAYLHCERYQRTAARPAQRLLLSRFSDPFWLLTSEDRAQPHPQFPAFGHPALSAALGRRHSAGARSVPARYLYAPSRTRHSPACSSVRSARRRFSGCRAAWIPWYKPFIKAASPMSGPTCSWMESACACGARRAANACKCWWLMGCAATAAGNCSLSCAAKAKPSRLGRSARRPLPARPDRRKSTTDRHRRLPGLSRRHPNRLSARAASTLLGAQDAQYSRTRAPPRFSCGEK